MRSGGALSQVGLEMKRVQVPQISSVNNPLPLLEHCDYPISILWNILI